jgi:hypothetical protein
MDAEPAALVGIKVVLLDRAGRYPDAPWLRIESLKELRAAISKL